MFFLIIKIYLKDFHLHVYKLSKIQMGLGDYKLPILIMIVGLVYFQYFMPHHSPNQKFQVSTDRVLFHANWTNSLDDLCCLSKLHNALALQNIQTLDLSFSMSNFNDSDLAKILDVQQFRQYKNVHIDLSGLKITNQGIYNVLRLIATGVENLQINLNGMKTTQGFGQALANRLNNLASLKTLKLSLIMSISDKQINQFIKSHNPTKNLVSSHLILIGNDITSAGVSHLEEYLGRLQVNELVLNLYANKLGHEGATIVANALKKKPQLQTLSLDFYFNNITEVGTQSVSNVVSTFKSLKHLQLNFDFNYIKNEGAKAIGVMLTNMTHLETLSLGVASKNFGYLGFKYVINGIEKLTQLKRLSLRCGVNRVGINGAEITQEMLAKMTQLEHLELGFLQNYIGDDGITLLSEQVAKMKTLKTVYLNFAFNDAKSYGLIKSVKSFINSKYDSLHLSFSSNQFRDTDVKLIENPLLTLVKNNGKFTFQFVETGISKKQSAKLSQIFVNANNQFNKNAKINVNSVIPEEEPAKPVANEQKVQKPKEQKPKAQPKVEQKTQKKVENKTQQKQQAANNTQQGEL